ncbi:hypothetical protein PV413_03545 [Streptomyces scabiei]|uniref:hypothetical protein n=1 Tax=Streptomyces scabiei TaxID=1930 RepID=UPI001B318684|nr:MULTISPECIES: hypothetical protein [Streptomyces]MDX2749584.1 hypothetical protein [Streptomyces scabiei]MDX3026782.1 hypothetical protein [Streptomyces scabiei]MDX3146548.1 hypothetical protein [Streptomyces scabiei]MDX3196954.1 hypothetical protein [Streptomyces scabiei]MDX3210060.1 hypothetical protein [Streptomyces scabiei]
MPVDTPTRLIDYLGTVDRSDEVKAQIEALASKWPEGAQVRHRDYDTKGVIRLDSPAKVPGLFHGKPSAWCLSDDGTARVCVVWGASGDVPLRVWQPAHALRLTGLSV